jgi:hypothetical protein
MFIRVEDVRCADMVSNAAHTTVNIVYLPEYDAYCILQSTSSLTNGESLVVSTVLHQNWNRVASDHRPTREEAMKLGSVETQSMPVSNSKLHGGTKGVKMAKPPNCFILYRMEKQSDILAEHPGIHNSEICRITNSSDLTLANYSSHDHRKNVEE